MNGFGLTVNNGATAQLAGTGGDQIWGGATVAVNAGGVLDFNGRNEGFTSIGGTGTLTNTAASTVSTVSLGEGDTDSTFSGTLQNGPGLLAFNKTGYGTVALDGANTYSCGTTITTGTLQANNNNSVGTGTVTVKPEGTLLVKSGVSVANPIVLAGGSFNREIGAGSSLANAINSTSHLETGGHDTAAKLLDGVASSSSTVQSSFTNTGLAYNDDMRVSDVYTLSGIPVLDSDTGMTDTFVLQLALPAATADSYLAWLNPETSLWVNAVEGNFGGTLTFVLGAYDPEVDFHLGTYGVDPTTGSVWAVINHNSSFAVVPEPGTWLMLALGLGLLGYVQSRRRQSTVN